MQINGKTYEFRKYDPVIGRRIMVKNSLPDPLKIEQWCREDHYRLMMVMEHIDVVLTSDVKIPLNSNALISNHVADKATFLNLVWASLEHNYGEAWNIAGGRKVKDMVWGFIENCVVSAIDEAIEAL